MSGIERIAAERKRQIEVEGWTHPHDDHHSDASLAWAAVCYAAPGLVFTKQFHMDGFTMKDPWPWEYGADKRGRDDNRDIITGWKQPDERRIDLLVKAGALIAAEIDRLERKCAAQMKGGE